MKKLQLILAFVTVFLGLALCYVAMETPPEGEIDPTALVAYGETLTFAGAVIGIDYKYRASDNQNTNNLNLNNHGNTNQPTEPSKTTTQPGQDS